ncbi:MAG TPA: hypothetical protein VHT91_35370 [Kofleriaceae bacterium]|jgi:hypothetical protein|nr:hypothetical protein [Kofleriaceae bacterium]
MRASHLVISRVIPPVISRVIPLLGAGVLGCGGSSPAKPDAPPPVDAFVCSQSGTVNAPTALDFSQGQAQGVAMNQAPLAVTVIVTSTSQPDRGFFIFQVNNGGVYSDAAGKAGRFEKPPMPGSYPVDPDMTAGFAIDFVDGVTHSGSSASARPTQVALLDTAGGTVRIDSFTPAATPGGTSTLGATITNAKFKGFNVLPTGNLDPAGNGCDVTVQNLAFTGLSVKWQTAPFPTSVAPPAQPDAAARPELAVRPIDGAAAISADFRLE